MKSKEKNGVSCFETLPDGYREALRLDAASKKTGILLTLASFGLTVLSAVPFLLIMSLGKGFEEAFRPFWITLVLFAPLMIGTLILHELVHGAAYKMMTGRKLTFGIKWSCAYCGLPDVYTTTRTAVLATLAPFVLFSAIFLIGLFAGPIGTRLLFLFLFALHTGGCVGDLWVAWLLKCKFPKETLLRDTGPVQTFYVPDR